MSPLCLASLLSLVLCTSTNYVSALITTQCNKKLLWWGLRIIWIYQNRNKNLEALLKLCPFSWVRVIRWPLWSKSSPFMRFEIDLQYQTCVSSFKANLISNQKATDYPLHVLLLYLQAYLALLVIIIVHRSCSWVRLLDFVCCCFPQKCM